MAVSQDTRLGCGRLIDEVWATADQPPDAHERDCPYCRRARGSLTDVVAATSELRRHEEETLRPGPRVRTAVMSLVHAQVRRTQPVPLAVPEPGLAAELTISEQAVVAAVWTAADAAPGVRVRRCHVRVLPTGQVPGRPAAVGIAVTVAVSVDVAMRSSITAVVPDLRARISTVLAAETGLDARSVDVTVEDVFDA